MMTIHDFPVVYPQSCGSDLQLVKWELHLQELAIAISQLCELTPSTIELRLLRDQYATKAQEMLAAVRHWCWTTDSDRKQVAYRLMQQKYTILNRLWLRIRNLGEGGLETVEAMV
jgi:RNA:NAD 2'-phosphotransferase (TPT1/KptA family)